VVTKRILHWGIRVEVSFYQLETKRKIFSTKNEQENIKFQNLVRGLDPTSTPLPMTNACIALCARRISLEHTGICRNVIEKMLFR